MPIIQSDTGIVTQINLFTVEPGQQADLIAYLAQAAQAASEVEGWLSASLHRSLDGTRVVNYAQSRDAAAAQRVITHLGRNGWIAGNKRFATANPGLYEVVHTLER